MNSNRELAAIETDVHKMRAGLLYLFAKLEVKERYVSDLVDVVWTGVSTFVPGGRVIKMGLTSVGVKESLAKLMEEKFVDGVRGTAAYIEDTFIRMRMSLLQGLHELWSEFRACLNKAFAAVAGLGAKFQAKAEKILARPPSELIEGIMEAILVFVLPAATTTLQTAQKLVDSVIRFFHHGAQLIRNAFSLGIKAFQEGFQRDVVRGVYFASGVMRAYDVIEAAKSASSLVKLGFPFMLVRNVVKIFMRFYECRVIKDLIAEARERYEWGGYELGGRFSFTNETAGSIARRCDDFNEWFSPYALFAPAVSSLALSCQVFGNEMFYLNLADNGDRAIPATHKGVQYSRYDLKQNKAMNFVSSFLKSEASKYLKQCGIEFSHPDLPIVQTRAMLEHGEHRIRPTVIGMLGEMLGNMFDFSSVADAVPAPGSSSA